MTHARTTAPMVLLAGVSIAAGASLAAGGCSQGQSAVQVSGLDVGYFECEVQPILDRGCAFTACHGDPGRALFVYSMSKRRIVPQELIGEVLTDKELCSNYWRTASFATEDPTQSQLLTKPQTLDGLQSQYHAGNYLFGPEDAESECLRAWLDGATHSPGSTTPSAPCRLPWRIAFDGTPAACAPRRVDCDQALLGPDLPEVAR